VAVACFKALVQYLPGGILESHECYGSQSRSEHDNSRIFGFSVSLLSRPSNFLYIYIGKDKAAPLRIWGGPEGSRPLRFPDFMTTAKHGGKVVSLTHRPPLPPGNTPGTHFC